MAGEKNRQAVDAAKPSSSQNRTEKALKPKAKIEKKPADNNPTKIKKAIGTPQTRGKKNKKKQRIVSGDNRGNSEKQDVEKLNSMEVKEKGIASKERNVNNQQIIKPKEKLGNLQKEQQNQKKNEERRVLDLEKRKSQMNKGKRADTEKNLPKEKKKEKLGGLIFMCSAKTKPDCFRYRVMGVSISKKELVLGIKPGIKLFLYDFDLRLLYGVYKASSSGGLKLEPTAFNGAFPVQVRFTVHQDCYPLPESVFRKAIKENYNESNKFDTELTIKQVKKLVELFQPADFMPKAPVISPQPIVAIQSREPHARDHKKYEEIGRYSMLPIEDDLHLSKKEVPSRQREEFRQDTFLSEKEYRAYGLRGERPNPPPPIHVARVVEPYARAHVTDDGLRHPSAVYSDMAAPQREATRRQNELSLNGREYQTYGIGARLELQQPVLPVTSTAGSMHDSYSNYYHPRYGFLAMDPYQPPTRRDDVTPGSSYLGAVERRETYPIETDSLPRREAYVTDSSDPLFRRASYLTEHDYLRRRENDDVGRMYATSASRPLFDYNQTRNYQEPRPDPSQTPVSSRYSFAGPSTLYR